MLNKRYFGFFVSLLLLLTGCTSMQVNDIQPVALAPNGPVAVFPFTNLTETPQAEQRASAITAGLLRARGVAIVMSYPTPETRPTLIPGVSAPVPRYELKEWARRCGARYVLTGSVNEWRYKVGLDGEPVVGVSMEIIDLQNNTIVWSGVGSKSGGSRTALSTVAQRLIATMLNSIVVGCRG